MPCAPMQISPACYPKPSNLLIPLRTRLDPHQTRTQFRTLARCCQVENRPGWGTPYPQTGESAICVRRLTFSRRPAKSCLVSNRTPKTVREVDDTNYGPAMAVLTEKQRAFVMALVDCGGNATSAARKAGYLDSGNGGINVLAHRLTHDERIQNALIEESRKRIKAASIIAVDFLVDVLKSAKYEQKERLKAAEMLLNRGGLHALTEHKVDVVHKQDTDSQILEVYQGAMRLGIDPRTLLGDLADRVNKDMGTIEVVPKEPDGQAEPEPEQENVDDLI